MAVVKVVVMAMVIVKVVLIEMEMVVMVSVVVVRNVVLVYLFIDIHSSNRRIRLNLHICSSARFSVFLSSCLFVRDVTCSGGSQETQNQDQNKIKDKKQSRYS